MKQFISVEQLSELSDSGKNNLREFIKEKSPNLSEMAVGHDRLTEQISLLSIGLMIEFLEHKGQLGQIHHLLGWTGEWCRWRITDKEGKPAHIDGNPDFIELCDTLWQAVKKILNE